PYAEEEPPRGAIGFAASAPTIARVAHRPAWFLSLAETLADEASGDVTRLRHGGCGLFGGGGEHLERFGCQGG
ncbi:Os10g0556500, partial [Oryza sativa Japonica Group]